MTCGIFGMEWGAVATALIFNTLFLVVGVLIGQRGAADRSGKND